jgi:U32 family peptidase
MLESPLSVGDGIRILNASKDEGGTVSRILLNGGKVTSARPKERVTLDVTSRMDIGADVMKTYDKTLFESLEEDVRSGFRTVPVNIHAVLEADRPMVLSMRSATYEVTVESKTCVSRSEGMPLDEGRVRELLFRLGNTDFHAEEVDVTLGDNVFFPVGLINALRREAVRELSILMARPRRDKSNDVLAVKPLAMAKGTPSLVVRLMTEEQLDHAIARGLKHIIVDHMIWREGLPEGFIKALPKINDDLSCPHDVPLMVTGVGALHACAKDTLSFSDTTFNVTNIESAAFLSSHGVGSVMLSLELPVPRIMAFPSLYRRRFGMEARLGVQVFGRTELMISKHCPVAAAKGTEAGCDLCLRHRYSLEGLNGSTYPLMTDGACNIRLFSAKPVDHTAHAQGFMDAGIDDLVIRFTDETPDEMERIIGRLESVFSQASPTSVSDQTPI